MSSLTFESYRVQGFANGASDVPAVHRFHDVAPYPQLLGLFRRHDFAEARAEDNGHAGPDGQDRFGEFRAGHVRHGHVRDHEIEIPLPGPEELERLDTACPRRDPVPERAEQPAGQVDQHRFVIHEEDTLVAAGYLRLKPGGLSRGMTQPGAGIP